MTDQQQTHDRLFMQYLLTQAGDARLSKIEARLDALDNKDDTTAKTEEDTLPISHPCFILIFLSLLVLMISTRNNPDLPPRLDFLLIIRNFLRPVVLWLLDDHDEKTWANTD
jgi:hypothetical protein